MENPTIIVTGASRGLGAAICQVLVKAGANVVLSSRSTEALEETRKGLNAQDDQTLTIRGDVRSEADCAALVQATLDQFGQIDGLINKAGEIEPIARIADVNLNAWRSNLETNYLGPLVLIQKCLPSLRSRQGKIINLSSGSASTPISGWGAYSTAKPAPAHLTRVLAQEEPEITTLAVRPGLVETQMQAVIRQKGKGIMAESNYNRLAGAFEQGKLERPEDPGRAIALMALYAPHEWSGETLLWDDARVQQFVQSISKSKE